MFLKLFLSFLLNLLFLFFWKFPPLLLFWLLFWLWKGPLILLIFALCSPACKLDINFKSSITKPWPWHLSHFVVKISEMLWPCLCLVNSTSPRSESCPIWGFALSDSSASSKYSKSFNLSSLVAISIKSTTTMPPMFLNFNCLAISSAA